jgi:hypothetical protein
VEDEVVDGATCAIDSLTRRVNGTDRVEDLRDASNEVYTRLRTKSSLFVSRTGRNCSRFGATQTGSVCNHKRAIWCEMRHRRRKKGKRKEKKQSCAYILEHRQKQCNRASANSGFCLNLLEISSSNATNLGRNTISPSSAPRSRSGSAINSVDLHDTRARCLRKGSLSRMGLPISLGRGLA